MKDFTLDQYRNLIVCLKKQNYEFLTYKDFAKSRSKRAICLRHDVDRLPLNSLEFARIQYELGINGTYYFRIVKKSWDESVIKEISSLGHEIGYHYEDLTNTSRFGFQSFKSFPDKNKDKLDSNITRAIRSFEANLRKLREVSSVSTICMHGSPASKHDSKKLWKYYDYREYKIDAEPYFDVDFSHVLYLTDTGRRWNGSKVSVRDKLTSVSKIEESKNLYSDWKVKPKYNSSMMMSKEATDFQNQHKYSSTRDIINSIELGLLPDKLMFTFHPQRWTDRSLPWLKELIWQNSKNILKYLLIKVRR